VTETVDKNIHRGLKQCADTDVSYIFKMTKVMKDLKPALGNTVIPQDPITLLWRTY
jgi:hypothetical protein